jgi:hemolysin-type calcium-binding region
VVGVLVSETEAKVLVASGARLTAQKDVNILASANSLLAEVALSVAVAPSATAVGGEVLVNVLNHKAIVELGSAAVESLGGNVTVHSSGEDTAVIVGVAVGASGTGNTVSGTIPVTVSTNAIETRVGAGSQITAFDSVDISADLQALYALAAGGISVGTTGVGATVGTLVLSNSVLTTVETGSRITAKTYDSGSNILQNRYNRRRGVNISANARETVVMAEVSAAAGTGNAITGTVATLVVSNKVKAEIGDAVTVTVGVEGDKDSEEGDLSVDASDDTFVVEFAGALSAAGSVGVGATVVVGVFDKNVKASVGNSGSVNASGTVSVTAENKSTLDLLAVAFGASGSTAVAGDVNALVFMNSTQASLGGNVTGANAIRVRANDDSKLLNIGIGVAASGAAAVTAVAVVTYFENKTLAQVLDKALLQAGNGGVEVIAVSREFVSGDAAGMSGGGTAGVGGTLDVVVLRFRTEALTGSNVTIRTTGDLTVRAEDNYGLVAAVVTLAASGTAAVGVNALVSVSFATVRAAIGVENTVEARNVTVQGSSQRDLLSVSASVAGSGVAAVGVNLSVVVAGALMSRDAHDSLYGTVENGGSTYTLYTFTPKGSGSVTLYEQGGSFYKAKTDSQGKEQRDSNNQLILEAFTVSEEDRKYLAPAAMNPETQVSGAFAAGNGQYLQGRDPSQKVGQSLQGDGQKLGTEDYGNYGQESTDTAPVKGDGKLYIKNSDGTYTAITDEEASTTYRNTQRYLYDTRNSTYVETDLTSANTFNDSTFAATGGTGYTVQKLPQLSDATSAIIGGNSLVTAAENIRVLASDNLNANMISGSIAVGGGGAGVGVGLTVSVLSSNVNALVDTGAVLSAGGNIEVKSWVGAKAQSVKTHSDRNNRVSNSGTNEQMDALGIPTQENSTIRLISVTAGGGFVGVGVSGAVLVVTSESNAILRGSVAKAANLYVESCMNFGDVLTVNTGISAGAVAVNVSIGATYFQGSSVAAIDGNGRIENISGTIRVCNSGTTNSQVAVAALAAGGVAVNAGIATAINLTKVRTYVGKNVTVSAPNALLVVSHDFTANAQGGILSISAGAVATGACVVVVVNKLDARAYVGFAPDETVTGESGSIQVRSITVTAEAAGKTEVLGAGIAGGAIAGNGIVAVGLGFITNIGAIRGVDITTGDLTVKAAIDGDVHVVSTGVTGGAVAVGATVDVAYIGSVNKAILDLTGAKVKVTGGVRVQAGSQDKPNDSYSRIIAVTGSAGSAAVGINLALAFNKAVNNAELLGLTGSMEAESLGVLAYGSAKAHTLVVNAALGGVTASATLAFAWVGSQQQARLDTAENLTVQKDVLVSSVLSAASAEDLTAEQKKGSEDKSTTVRFTKVAESRIYTASAGMLTATGNGAVALSDGTSSAWASFGGKAGKVAVSNTAASTAYAGIENFSLGGVSVGVMMGYSFASGTFEAVLNAQKALTCEDITVTNTYTSLADTNVTPASGGVSATLTNIGLNTAVACATTTANTGISGTGTLDVHGNMAVTAQGTAQANANIMTPTASFSVVAVTANVAVAVNNVRQNTFVRDCSLNTVTGDVTLVSNLNKNSQMGAKARVGASTATSGSVSYANLTANACVANFNAVHTALVSGISGTIHGTLSVMANTASLADAGVYSGSAVSYYSGTVTVVYAYAGGSSKADLYLEKNKKLRVGKLNLTNQYQTKATAESKQSDNGISVNMAAADLNVAYAEACSVACAGIEGDGSLSAEDGEGDSLIVLCQGTAAADAKILPANVSIAGVKLAANNVFSKVTAQHTAHIGSESTAPDVSSNGNISVISRFNESGDGATATVGSGNSSNVNVSLLGVTESLALAEMEAQAKAAIVNGTIRAKGNVDVQMLGRLIAKAEVYNGSTLGLYNATVMVVRANAKGSMEALLNAKTIEAATVNVKNDYYAQSEAETGFAGGLVAGIGSASSNVAYATTSSTAKAAFGAAAGGNITGSISLENLGRVSAKALGRSATVTVSGLNVAVNVINADLNAVQNTSFTYGGKLDIKGDVNIRSEILREGDFGKADAQTGSTAGASISLVGASANKATAATATQNTLTVRGVGENRMTLTGSFTARAKSVTESFAKAALPQSLGLASIGSMISDSSTRDVVSVTVTGACMEIDGTFKAESIGNTASTSEAHKAGGVGVVGATATTSDAKVGAASDKPQTVGLTVTGGSIQALEDIILRAYNTGKAQSIVKKGTEVSGIGITKTSLPTNSWYSTNVSVTGGAVLTAEGSITLTSEDTTEAKADATGTNIGFAINADYTKGENHITSNNTVTIGAKLQADDSLTVTADSKATMTAKTVADGGGFFTKGTLTAINELIRSCLITIAENSDLSANHGSLSICANAGENDVITTTAKITSGGVVALGKVQTNLTLKTTSKVDIQNVGSIQNRFGTVTIRANASQNGVVTNSSADCSGLGVAPDVHNQATIELNSDVSIRNVQVIEGRYVYINAVLKKLDVYSYGYAKGSGLGAKIDAMNDLTVSLTANTRVEGVTVIGHDGAVINATSEPDYLDANVHTDARVQLNAIGDAYAKSKVITREAATVTVQDLTYKGASIRIDNRKITGDRIRHEEHTGGFIRKHTSDNSDFQSSSSITVKDITLYLGDAAAGVFIDVSEKSGVRQVGIRNEEQIWMEAGSTLTFGNIANYLPGYAYLYGSVTGLTVYDQSMLPALTVTNSTNMDLIFKSMTYVNTGFVNPKVFIDGKRSSDYKLLHTQYAPEFTVTSSGTGGVRLTGLIPVYNGTATITWIGETGGALTAVSQVGSAAGAISPLWAHTLVVSGAALVGSSSEKFSPWIFSQGTAVGTVQVSALRDIYMSVTGLGIEWVKELPDDPQPTGRDIQVELSNIQSVEGNVYLSLEKGRKIYWVVGTTTVTIPVPETLDYVVGSQVNLANNYIIQGMDMLERYLTAYDPAEDLYLYQLPNGSLIYADKNGNIARIVENGITSNVGNYQFIYGPDGKVQQIKLSGGISIDLLTGRLTVEEDASFEVLTQVVTQQWLKTVGLFDGMTIRLTKNVGGKLMEWETRLVEAQGFAPDGKQYYYVEGLYPSFENVLSSGNAENRTVYYLVERDGDSVKFYALSAVTEQRVDHKEKFSGYYLMIENGAVEMHNGYYRDARSKKDALLARNAHCLDYVRIEANGTEFVFEKFLGTDLTVTVKRENGVLGYYVGGQKLSVSETVYGVTVTDPTSPLYHIFWNAAYVTQAQSEVEVTDTNIKLEANFENNTFGITQIRHVTWRPHYAWTNRTFQAMQKSVVVQYYKLEEVSASISNESQFSGVRFTAPDPNDPQKTTYFYEFKDENGKAYYMDGLGSDAKRVNVEQKVDTHQEALGYSKLLLNGMEVKYGTDTGVACFANKQPKMEINNVKYYQLGMMDEDGNIVYHPYKFQEPILENGQATGEMEDVEYILYVAVSGDQVSIVKEKQRPDIAPEKGDKEGYWQDNGGTRYEKGELATATISVVQTKEDGTQETVSVQGSFEAFGKDQSIPYYRKTTVENNATVYTFYRQTGTDTNGTALYALCADTPINWQLTGNVFLNYKPEGDSGSTTQPLTQRDGTNERYLLVNEKAFDNWQKDKRLELYYTDGNLCQEYEILCKWEGRKKTYQLVYAAGQQYRIVESGYTQQAQYKEWTETYHVATFTASGRTVRFDRNSRENFIDPTRHSAEQNSQVLVLRFGSAGHTITFTGKIKDIGLNTTKLPANAVATGSDAYKVTESMYLTKSGLIVNIKGDFASKFDGKVYISTKLIAEELGKLAVSKNLTGVNENGETIYVDSQNHVYVMNHQGLFHCAETDHTMTEAETLGILYEVQPTQNSGPKITVLKGQNITLERLTDHIAHDINNISTTGNWRYDGTFYYSADGENGWTAIPEGNVQVKNGVITVSYFDSKAQRNVELRIYKGQDSQKEITFMEFATYDKDGNPVYVKAGSDGSVVMVGAPATQKISTVESGTDYTVKNITAGENVEIRVNDPNGSLFNGNDDPQAPCVVAKEKATIISAGGKGSIGTEDKPLNIQAKEIEFLNQDMEQVIVKDTYVYIDQGDTSLDGNIVVDGVIWKLETADGSVTAADKTLTVKNGGTASILTNKEPTATSSGNVELKTITVTGKDSTLQVQAPGAVKTEALTVTDGGTVDIDAGTIHVTGNETVTGGSTVTKTAEGNITVDGNREVTGSTLTETSTNGSIAVGGDETVTGGSTVTKDAKGDITVGGDQRVTGSTLTETSSNGSIETKGNVTLADSEAHLTAHKDLTVEGNLAVTGGTLKAQAETGSVTLTKLRTWQTTTDFQAGADMRFDDWMSAESKNTVSVGGTFGVRTQGGTSFETYEQGYGNRAFVKYADTDNNTNALFSLSAGSVGTKDNWLVVDIPAELTMKLPKVGDLYVDVLELIVAQEQSMKPIWMTQDDLLLDGYCITTRDNPKVNEFPGRDPETGKEGLVGDYLKNISTETAETTFKLPESADLAHRFTAGGRNLEDILDGVAVKSMIGAELDSKALAGILGDQKREELLQNLGMLNGLSQEQKQSLLNPNHAEATMKAILQQGSGAVDAIYTALKTTNAEEQQKFLAQLLDIQTGGKTDKQPIENLDRLIGELLTDEEWEELFQKAIREHETPTSQDTGETEPRAFHGEIGVSTGVTTLYNDGDIHLVVTGTSDLTAENIKSERGDVYLDVQSGNILAAGDGPHITGENIRLNASGSIGTQDKPIITEQVKEAPGVVVNVLPGSQKVHGEIFLDAQGQKRFVWTMDVDLVYDWVRLDDLSAAKRLDANAQNGSIYVTEQTGNMGLGSLTAADHVSVQAPGILADTRTPEQKAAGTPNIQGTTGTLHSTDAQIGTEQAPITVKITDHLTASAEENVNLKSQEDLYVTADTQNGKLNIDGDQNLTVDNTAASANGSGDMPVGTVTAGGTAELRAVGDILGVEDRSLVSADRIILSAGGSIGSPEDPLRVDTASGNTGSGTLTATAKDRIDLEEITGDLTIDRVVSGTDTVLTAPGSMTDANGNATAEAADSQKKANDAKNLSDAAQAESSVRDQYASALEQTAAQKQALAAQAQKKLDEAQKKLQDTLAADPQADVTDLQNQLENLRKLRDAHKAVADQARKNAEDQRALADAAAQKAQKLLDEAQKAQTDADKALENARNTPPSVQTGGDLTLNAGGSIGEEDNALDTQVGGKTNLKSGGNVNLSEQGDMHLGEVQNPENAELRLDSTGGITSDSVLGGSHLEANALGGSLDVQTDVDGISGTAAENITVNNAGDLEMGDLTANGLVNVKAGGHLTAGTVPEGTANITAGTLHLTAGTGSSIGQEEHHLVVDTDRVSAKGVEVYLDFLKDVIIDHIQGDRVDIDVNGGVGAGDGVPEHITAGTLELDALGDIGSEKRPLIIRVPGDVHINSRFGSIFVRNIYSVAMQALIRGFGNIVSDRDFRFMPYGFARLRPETLAGETLTLKEVWGTRSVTITGQRLEEIQGDVLYIWALEADGITLTHSLRHLHLNRATIQSITSQGYRWLLFRVGNSLVLIHLEALSDGDYLITLDPENQEIPLSAELNETTLTVPSEEIFSAALTAPLDRP